MRIILKELTISNFKKFKAFTFKPDGKNAVVSGANAVGKTTLYDVFLWLFFDKDSEGHGEFGHRPVDKENNPIKGLVVQAIITLDLDGKTSVFRKEEHERIVKNQLHGYTTLCWIDDVPKKVGEFNDAIKEIIDEDTFKMLTDLRFFSEKINWVQRRQILLDIAGDVAKPQGFEHLLADLSGRSIKEYEDMLKSQKKKHNKEREEINPRIDELQKGLTEYTKDDTDDKTQLEQMRDIAKAEIAKLNTLQDGVIITSQDRERQVVTIGVLNGKLSARKAVIEQMAGNADSFTPEIAKLQAAISEVEARIDYYGEEVKRRQEAKEASQHTLERYQTEIAEQVKKIQGLQAEGLPSVCKLCGQQLPANKIAEYQQKKDDVIIEAEERAASLKEKTDSQKKLLGNINLQINTANKLQRGAETVTKAAKEKFEKRSKQIEELIAGQAAPNLMADEQYKDLQQQIAETEAALPEPASELLQEIEQRRQAEQARIKTVDTALAQHDRIIRDTERINELKTKETTLAQQIADLDKILSQVGEYKRAESTLIEQTVNSKFTQAKFKLFEQLMNGEIRDCCETMYEGKLWRDMSSGEKIFVGLDIVNTLSKHYGESLPLFIDHFESVTLPLETHVQTIKLAAKQGKPLTVEIG